MRFDGIADSDVVHSDSVFAVVPRPRTRPQGEHWVQPPPETLPQQDYSFVHDERRGLALLVQGLPEIAPAHDDKHGTGLVLTLLRCTGWLSRDDHAARRQRHAGPALPTPQAQCPGLQHFRYAIVPLGASPLQDGLDELSQDWRVPALATQGRSGGALPSGHGLLEVAGAGIRVSAVKRHEERESLVVRLVNLHGDARTVQLRSGIPIGEAHALDLLEARHEALPLAGQHELELTLPAHRIQTLELVPTARS